VSGHRNIDVLAGDRRRVRDESPESVVSVRVNRVGLYNRIVVL
jgi:hypothetical protein